MKPPPYPRVPHLTAAGTKDDKRLPPDAVAELLRHELEVEEKLDGANTMCWVENGIVHASGRSGRHGMDRGNQFGTLRGWTAEHSDTIKDLLGPGEVLYGEWMLLTHTITYTRLPSYFIALDLMRADGRFVESEVRRAMLSEAGFTVPPLIGRGRWTLKSLESACHASAWSDGPAEGVVVRPMGDAATPRAKLVRADFIQIDDAQWRSDRGRNTVV